MFKKSILSITLIVILTHTTAIHADHSSFNLNKAKVTSAKDYSLSHKIDTLKTDESDNEYEIAKQHEKEFNYSRWSQAMIQKQKMTKYQKQNVNYDPGVKSILAISPKSIGSFVSRNQKTTNGGVQVSSAKNPDPNGSFGFVGTFAKVTLKSSDKIDGTLVLKFNPIHLGTVDRNSLRVFYWNKASKKFIKTDYSGISHVQGAHYVWAHITKTGVYAVIGRNTDPNITSFIQIVGGLKRFKDRNVEGCLRDICNQIFCSGHANSRYCDICLDAVTGIGSSPDIEIGSEDITSVCSDAPKWESCGPVNISGVIGQIIIDPANHDILYAASKDGGIWRLDSVRNYPNVSWHPLTDKLGIIKMSSVTKAKSSRIYATSAFGQIFRSDDNGEEWKSKGAIGSGSTHINKIIVVPQDDDHVFIASDKGLRESTDGGNSWSTVTIPGLTNSANIYDIILDPNDSSVIYIAVHYKGIFRRDSTGWSNISSGISSGTPTYNCPPASPTYYCPPTYNWPKIAISVDSSNSNRKIIALKTSVEKICNDGKTHYMPQIFQGKETSSGTYDWDEITPKISGFNIDSNYSNSICPKNAYFGDWLKDQSGWANSIAINPNDSQNILIGGMRVFRTDDGGVSWNWTGGYHADIQSIVFDQSTSDLVYISTDGGIFRSFDAGTTWNDNTNNLWKIVNIDSEMNNGHNLNRNLATSQIFRAGVNVNTTFATVDHWGHVGSPDLSAMKWEADIGGSEWGGIYPDPYQDDIYYYLMAQNNAHLWRVKYPPIDHRQELTTFDVYRSLTDGLQGPIGIADDNKTLVIVKKDKINTVKTYKLMITHDANNTTPSWVAAKEPSGATLISTDNPIAQVVVSPTGKTYAMTSDGSSLWVNSNVKDATNDDQWQKISINPALKPNISSCSRHANVRHLIVDPENQNNLYAVFSGEEPECNLIAVSHDGGNNWTRNGWDTISASLPVSKLNSITLYNGVLLLGMDTGVYASTDEGASWTAFYPDSLPNVEIRQTFARDEFLYAVTYGRGLWRIKLDEAVLGRR